MEQVYLPAVFSILSLPPSLHLNSPLSPFPSLSLLHPLLRPLPHLLTHHPLPLLPPLTFLPTSPPSVTASVKDRQNFMHYIKQSKVVSRAAHPHMVNMVGCVTLHDPVCLAAHYPAGGTLLAFLERNRKEVCTLISSQCHPWAHFGTCYKRRAVVCQIMKSSGRRT